MLAWVPKLRADFEGFTLYDAFAILGNAGHESGGLTLMQEQGVKAGTGGYGPFQWTGSRRKDYEKWLARKGVGVPGNLETDYAFLFRELTGPEKRAVPAIKAATSLYDKVVAFERAFERAGVKHYASRYAWALAAQGVWEEFGEESSSTAPEEAPEDPAEPRDITAVLAHLRAAEASLGAARALLEAL